jgi:hypothetical protein
MPGGLPEAQGSAVCQVIPFAMYAFRQLRDSPDRFLNPWENSCRGRWSCRGTVWICVPVSDPRPSCLSRRQLVVSMLFTIFDSEALLRELYQCRETVLQIPIAQPGMPLIFDIQLAVAVIWNLTDNLRYLPHLHRDGQRAIGKQQAQSLSNALLESTPLPHLNKSWARSWGR